MTFLITTIPDRNHLWKEKFILLTGSEGSVHYSEESMAEFTTADAKQGLGYGWANLQGSVPK